MGITWANATVAEGVICIMSVTGSMYLSSYCYQRREVHWSEITACMGLVQ